ncbi:unnamed protein product [Aphanomyces euteiches]|nr:hypothetical protein Ae201684P_016469 [Aphanomyces euteiches]KAH9140809.1 hypothetical protein AeRB84_014988 [Aphanomyces euteiches]
MDHRGHTRAEAEPPYEAAETPRHIALTIQEQERRHDEDLVEILAGAKRTKDLAKGIHTEVQSQNNMIDDIGREVTRATAEVEREEKKAAAVNKLRGKLWKLYLAIVLLTLSLIILSQLNFKVALLLSPLELKFMK